MLSYRAFIAIMMPLLGCSTSPRSRRNCSLRFTLKLGSTALSGIHIECKSNTHNLHAIVTYNPLIHGDHAGGYSQAALKLSSVCVVQYILRFGCGHRVIRAAFARPNPFVVSFGEDGPPALWATECRTVGSELGRVAAAGALAPELLVPGQLLSSQRRRLQGVHVGEGDALAFPDVSLCSELAIENWSIVLRSNSRPSTSYTSGDLTARASVHVRRPGGDGSSPFSSRCN